MSSRRPRLAARRTSLMTATFAASLPLALASLAGSAVAMGVEPVRPASGEVEALATASVVRGEELLAAGRPVAARAAVADLVLAGLSAETRERAATVASEAGRQIRLLDAAELSLQKAELMLEQGDVRGAGEQVNAVLAGTGAVGPQRERAVSLKGKVESKTKELEPLVADALAQAEKDFLAGRYAAAKSGLTMVGRSGVALSASQRATLEKYRVALVNLAEREPGLFGGPVASAGMLQPGVVRRQGEGEQPAQPPVNQPGGQPVAPAPAQPEPVPTPGPEVVQPGDAVAPAAAQPANGDPILAARRAELSDLLAQADRAYAERRYADSLTRYERARVDFRDLLAGEESATVERRVAELRAALASDRLGPEGVGADSALAKQQLLAEFENDMERARAALTSGDADGARNRLAQAGIRVESGRNLFSEAELEGLRGRVSAMRGEIDQASTRLEAERVAERDRTLQEQTQEAQRTAAADRERKVAELINRARAFQAEKRYREALQTIDQLMFLDPLNPTGMLLRDAYNDVLVFQQYDELYREKQARRGVLAVEAQRASVPALNIVEFPADWPAISARRGEPAQYAEPAENRRVLAELNAKRLPTVSFSDNTLEAVVRFFGTVSGMNVDVDWASLEEAGIRRESTLSLNLVNVTQKQLLDRVVEKVSGADRQSRADWGVFDGVVTIASDARIRRNKVLVIYDVKDLLVEVPDYTDAPRIDLQQALQSAQSGGGGGGQSPFQNNQQQQAQARQTTRGDRMQALESIITNNVDFDGWQVNGGDTGTIQRLETQGALIITNTPKNHREVAGLLRKLRDVRALQINVECRFLLVNQDFFEQIGFDLDVYFNADNNQVRAVRTVNPGIQARDFFNFTGQAPGLNRQVPGSFGTPAGGGTTQPTVGVPNPESWSPIGVGGNSLGLAGAVVPRSANWGDLILNSSPALGIAGQFLDDVQVDFLIKATQADRRSVQLTAPRLTFTNGQFSNIYVVTQTAFVSDLQPIVGDSAVGFQPTVAVIPEGVTLIVEGTVTSDRRYVTMNIDAGVSRVNGFAQQAVTAVAGGQLVNSASVQSFIQLPQTTVTRVQTTVTVPDQGTLLLGGQRLLTEYEVETGVPVLSKIPVINRFFTNRIESREEQTLMILAKPTILIQNEEEERNFPGLLQQLGVGGSQ